MDEALSLPEYLRTRSSVFEMVLDNRTLYCSMVKMV